MCEYLNLKTEKIEIWNFFVKCLEFEILKPKMSKFGCVNTKSWKLKSEIWNVWKESEILKIEMSKYWKLKIEMYPCNYPHCHIHHSPSCMFGLPTLTCHAYICMFKFVN